MYVDGHGDVFGIGVPQNFFRKYGGIFLVTFIGGLVRFWDLGIRPFWVDEVIFANMVKDVAYQEYVAVWVVKGLVGIFGGSEFVVRSFFALCGTLTVPAIWWVLGRKLWPAVIVCVFPLFVFWSRMARPYAFIGLMVVLSWRWWPLMMVGIVTSPLAVLGMKLPQRWWVVLLMLTLAIGVFLLRPDAGRTWSLSMLEYHTRFFYVPVLAFILYYFDRIESGLLGSGRQG